MIDRKNVANLYPLTPLQEGILYHALHAADSRAYFERLEFGLEGPLDAAIYRAAWQDLTDRHDILRTLFTVRNTPRPLQVVLKQWPVALEYQDLAELDAEAARTRIDAWKADDLARGFNLTGEVPLRLALFRTGAEHHRVVWSFNHILLDGWCLGILQHELDLCYLARLAGSIPHLPPAPRFATYVRWLEARDRQADSTYWRDLLADYDTPTPVPQRLAARFAAPTPSDVAGAGQRDEHIHTLPPAAAEALAAHARGIGVTPSSVVQTLWGLLLAGAQGTHDAVFAATVAGRPMELAGADATVGLFINAVPVRVRFSADETLGEVIRRTHEQGIASRPHHATPLAEVQAAHPLRGRLVDHVLVFENYPQHDIPADPRLPRACTEDADLHEYTHYGFEFQFLPGDGADQPTQLRFRFDARRYEAGAVARLGEQLAALLQSDVDPRCDAALAATLPTWRGPRRVALAASFTVEPVADAMSRWLRQFGQPATVELAPYNQCPRALLDPDSALARAELAFLLYHPEDALRDLGPDDGAAPAVLIERLRARHDAQCSAFANWCAVSDRPPLVVALLPTLHGGADDTPLATAVRQAADDWAATVARAASSRLVVLDLRNPGPATGLPLAAWPDAAALRLGHLPYTEAGSAALGTSLARAVLARSRAPLKVLAVDCDNTLWQGICGEAGALGVKVGPAQRALQEFLLARQDEGFLIVLASKNMPDDVWAVFDQHPNMLLRRQHIAAAAINWQAKSGNLRSLAQQLNLGIDSFVFLDDNPAEIAEVMHNCPEVLAFPLPADTGRIADWLALLWACDLPAVTAEDRERTRMMQAEATRQEVLARTHDLDEFLASIGLRLAIGPMAPHQLARVAQLTQRTNQFNLSGKRRSEAEVAALAARDDSVVLAVEVEDRFGVYGLTGVVIARMEGDGDHAELIIDTLLLSCRVLGRRVEQGILCALAHIAAARGARRIVAPLVPTERNDPIRQFLATPPWRAEAGHRYTCAVDVAGAAVSGITLSEHHVFTPPAAAPTATVAAPPAPLPTPIGADATGLPAPLPVPLAIDDASRLTHSAQYLPWFAAAAGWPTLIPPALRSQTAGLAAPGDSRAPRPGTETTVAQVWAEVLQLDQVPAETQFADLGGHSLHVVRVVSRLESRYAVRIGLAQFYALGTVTALAGWLDQQTPDRGIAAPLPRVPDAADYPLSHSQYRVWLLSRLGTAAEAYNQCAAWHLRGPLDVTALERAVEQVVARHEALRTVFRLTEDGPRQRVLGHVPPRLARETADGCDAEDLRGRIAAGGRRLFDLESGPLASFTLIECGPDEHALAISLHHIISDGWSFGLLLADLARAYRDGTLPAPPALRYRDYAAWSRSPACAATFAPHRDYWRERLGPAPALPALPMIPSDRPRPPLASGRGGALRRRLALNGEQQALLQRHLAEHGASLFQWLASLVMVLIAQHAEPSPSSADDDGVAVRIGTPVAGRDRTELEDVVGIFVNTLVLDARVRLGQPFSALLNQVRDTTRAALDHQHYPFDRLVEDMVPERDAARNPLFDVLVALQNTPRAQDGLPGVAITDLAVPLGVAAFDLVFEFAPEPDGLALELTYASDLYDAASADHLSERFEALLHVVLSDSERRIATLPLMGAREAATVARFSRGPLRPLPDDTLPARFTRMADTLPHATALVSDSETLDFATLAARAEHLARVLVAHGVQPGDRVAVLLPREVVWPVALLAALRVGAVYVPLELRHPPARLRDLLLDATPALLLTNAALADKLGATLPCAWLDPATASAPPAPVTGLPAIAPDNPAYLLYTSGSTGTPKGVLVSHRAFVNMIDAQIAGFEVDTGDVVLQIASCAFDASLSEFFLGWLGGAPVALADAATVGDSARLGAFLVRHGVTLATFTPSYLRHLEDRDVAGLSRVILAGEAVYGRDVSRLLALGIVPYNAYGPTETAVCATLGRVTTAPADAAPVPIGRPLANLHIEIRTPSGQPAPLGTPGEMVVFGPSVALGYWQRPDLTDARFVADAGSGRGYRTGDLARWRHDGSIEYLGRGDDMVKLRGLRIELGEVAARLRALPGVVQATASVEPGPTGDTLVAWVSPARQDQSALRAALAASLPPYMVPERWVCLEQLPLTTSGKLDQQNLPLETAPATGAPPTSVPTSPPDPLEAALLALWQRALGPQAGLESDFFACGGNSLLAMHTARRIATELDRDCPAILIFRHPTVRALAAALSAGRGDARYWSRWGDPGGALLVALPPAPGYGAVHAQLAARLNEYDFRAPDLGDEPLAVQLEHWADDIVASGRSPVLLGASGGGRLALALADVLSVRGHEARAVVLADTWRWNPADPELAPVLAELHRRAADDDRALATATGLEWSTELARHGQAYRRALETLDPPRWLRVPVLHLLADIDAASVPAGFSRDWSDWTSPASYRTLNLTGGHSALLSGPLLTDNADRLRAAIASFTSSPHPEHALPG
jgi:amino acid adenylation domain-containing protein/FkbH-like protein